jgi:2-octaprenyl-6-methoxyphenol hydroxylase
MNDKSVFDIAIIGGGLAGLTQAILLADHGWKIACIDRDIPQTQTDKTYDIRTTAISWGSRNLLLNAGIWQALEEKSEPIRDILILDENSPQTLDFNAESIGKDGFGWIVDNRDLRIQLHDLISKNKNITHITGQSVTAFDNQDETVQVILGNSDVLCAKLVIGADGRQSYTREAMGIGTWSRDYNQNAIVCLITHDKPHHGCAIEHFMAEGPFAVLPYTNNDQGQARSAVVWTIERSGSKDWVHCDDDLFISALQERLGDRFGTMTSVGRRAAYPLGLNKAYSYVGNRMVLIAEAAHGIHPIAGQGLNMSFRDIAVLTEILVDAKDPGDKTLLECYQSKRRGDNLSMVVATDTLNDLFGSRIPAIRAVRRFGLSVVARTPFVKRFFMQQAMGANGSLPNLVHDFYQDNSE